MSQITPKATTGAIIEKDGKVLLEKRNIEPFKGSWCLPGGHIELNETAEHAIIREIKEETSLDFKPRFFRYFDEIMPEIGWHSVVLIFTGDVEGSEEAEPTEVQELKWFGIDEAMKLKLAFRHKDILKEYYGGD